MNAERLLKLADFLETVPPHSFDMKEWITFTECGFAGCAIGWTPKAIPGEGFILKHHMADEYYPYYNGKERWRAVEEFFELEELEAEHLFMNSKYEESPTPNEVAARIREFVTQTP
jgi:hypothetical protein